MRLINLLKNNLLNLVVFLTGASILIIEITATRVLSPYFGNTTYTVTGVISVILLALSLGYYYGGRLADKNPSYKTFFTLIISGGLTTIFIQLLSVTLNPILSPLLPISTGPLIMATLLFCLPGILLGMLSPYAIKLQSIAHQEKGIGENAGTLFFFSTLGSIVGSMSTAFILIPNYGISNIIVGTGLFLILLGSIGMALTSSLQKKNKLYILIALFFTALASQTTNQSLIQNSIYFKDGTYEKIAVVDTNYNDRPLRLLTLDHNSSSGKYLDSNDLAFPYTKYYELYKLRNETPQRIAVLGAGAYSIPIRLNQELPDTIIEGIDIEPLLPSISKQYFGLSDNTNIHQITADARRHLQKSPHTYDLIFSDAFASKHSPPAHLGTQEFYQLIHTRLSTHGIFIANFHGSLEGQKAPLVLSSLKTIQSVFPQTYVFQVEGKDRQAISNIIIVAYKDTYEINSNSISQMTNLATDSILPSLLASQYIPPKAALANLPVLTDNYAPLEYLESKLF
jgi:spermidine synthase